MQVAPGPPPVTANANASPTIHQGVEALLGAPAVESPVVAIAGALPKSSALLKLAEASPLALAFASGKALRVEEKWLELQHRQMRGGLEGGRMRADTIDDFTCHLMTTAVAHLRSEGTQIIESLEELLTISRRAKIRAEIYHLKTAGRENWPKMNQVIAMVEKTRSEGHHITADVYTYPAGATGLNSTMPPWVQDGGFEASLCRMKDPATRKRIAREMRESRTGWENMYLQAGSPDKILLVGFKSEKLKPLTGKTLGEIAHLRGKSPEETAMDLIVEDESRIATVYFTQSEGNLRSKISHPWVSFCSDSESLAPEGVFLKSSVHPRAYGSFARLLARFVREEKLLTLSEAVRKLAALPAENLRLERRGRLRENYFADVVVFDPAKIQDHATYEKPHEYATGMVHVFVNGVQVLKDENHTGAKPGRFVRGPGWKR